MIYFIPAWYQQNKWCENEQSWYVRRMHTEFDDTVKQVQLFHRNTHYPYRILLLGYSPNFRHFLHRQSVYHAPYWSCFDAMQEVRRTKARLLSIQNLVWPEGIEFIYTPFVMVAMLGGEKYAEVKYGEDGNPIQIDLFENGKIHRQNIYDDRGFLSSTILYENEMPLYQDYLMENGIWKFREFFMDGHVEINSSYPQYLLSFDGKEYLRKYTRQLYQSLDQVIFEVFSAYIELTHKEDIFCAAMHERHTEVIRDALYGRKMILSFFGDRYGLEKQSAGKVLVERARYVITDSRENTHEVQKQLGHTIPNIVDITPFDTRMDVGISDQLTVQKILVPVDDMEQEKFEELIVLLANYMQENAHARVCLFTRIADYNRGSVLLAQTRAVLRNAGLQEGWAAEETRNPGFGENRLEEEEEVPVKFFVEQCVAELAVSRCMKEQRVLVDLRKVPELYLQIMAVSIGIPQIVREENRFAKNHRNSLVLKNLEQLPEALTYYLDGLANWNEAQVAAYELGKKYTTDVLLTKWREVINDIE